MKSFRRRIVEVGAASCFAVTPIRPVVVLETWLAPDE
jgi:hypothetical protein